MSFGRNLLAIGVAGLTGAACAVGQDAPVGMGDPVGVSGAGAGVSGSAGVGAGAAGGSVGGAGGGGMVAPPAPMTEGGDVGTKVIHRLSNTEYNNTVRDLLGATTRPADAFVFEQAEGFDTIATGLSMSPTQVEDYYASARTLSELVVPGSVAMACTPADGDTTCLAQVIDGFGLRAFRRPLEQWEKDLLNATFADAVAAGATALEGVQHVVKTMLGMPQFLYRIEFDADPSSAEPHALTAYELASRLSYMLWSTMPDTTLFELAASGQLLETAVLDAQVDRMLADTKSVMLVENFARQWLGTRRLPAHQVDPLLFPGWSDELRTAMDLEVSAYFSEFLYQDRPYTEFVSADFNYVDAALAAHYGMAAPAEAGLARVENTTDQRFGLLGLAGFLTHTSRLDRTAPTIRGKWILDSLWCQALEVPDNLIIAPLPEVDPNAPPKTVRELLAEHGNMPACAGCHNALDPIGLALEHFDAVGQYRAQYENGLAIDAVGELPGVPPFDGLQGLAQTLAADPRFLECAAEKLFTYGLGRAPGTSYAYMDQMVTQWQTGTPTLKNLLKQIVINDTFRFRRGETQ